MTGMEDLCLQERQIDLIVALDAQEDMALIEAGHGRHVDLWESNQFHMSVVNAIYGFSQDVNRKSGL